MTRSGDTGSAAGGRRLTNDPKLDWRFAFPGVSRSLQTPWPDELIAPLGAGGMGEVYRARTRASDETWRSKMMPAKVATDPDDSGDSSRKPAPPAALNHPNIVAVYDVGHHEGDARTS